MRKLIFCVGALLLGASTFGANAQQASDPYADCDCVTAPAALSSGVGSVLMANGDVLVDGARAANLQALQVGSEMIIGAGSANISVGQTCQLAIGSSSVVSISQPMGEGSNLCVKISSEAAAPPPTNAMGTLAVVGGAAAIIIIADDGDGRRPASP